MTLGIFFWVIVLLFVLIGFPGIPWGVYGPYGHFLLLVILIGTLGYHAFGSMIHG